MATILPQTGQGFASLLDRLRSQTTPALRSPLPASLRWISPPAPTSLIRLLSATYPVSLRPSQKSQASPRSIHLPMPARAAVPGWAWSISIAAGVATCLTSRVASVSTRGGSCNEQHPFHKTYPAQDLPRSRPGDRQSNWHRSHRAGPGSDPVSDPQFGTSPCLARRKSKHGRTSREGSQLSVQPIHRKTVLMSRRENHRSEAILNKKGLSHLRKPWPSEPGDLMNNNDDCSSSLSPDRIVTPYE